MQLNTWALKWQIPIEALEDLRDMFGTVNTDPLGSPPEGESEAAVQNRIRLEASAKGMRIWRNNVGSLLDERGIPVRFGLANDSKQMNEKLKSSDLIGIRPVRIQPHMVGQVIGQFVAREVKESEWSYKATKRELAQLRYLELVVSLGGDGAFANSEGSL